MLTKVDFIRRYSRKGGSEFGNCSPTWDTLGTFTESNYQGVVHLRNRVVGGPTFYSVTRKDVVEFLGVYWKGGRLDPKDFYISAMCPHEHNLLQGEVQVLPHSGGLQLTYSTAVGKPMRDALREKTQVASGIIAVRLLRSALCPNSYDWLNELLTRYPGHVVEFTALRIPWGTLYPLYNTLVWEVRMY